ncbi:MAG: DUF3330 domain-containing protein [Gammaproteobacteria bacterium]|nr:DUF3330 domain-containing protein [Gammaproteobacteria bacterium]
MSTKAHPAGKPTPEEPDKIACSVCLAEIPESVAVSREADDYTHHFCGLACYNRWRDENSHADGQATHTTTHTTKGNT